MAELANKIEKMLNIPTIKKIFAAAVEEHEAGVIKVRAEQVAQLQTREDDFRKSLALNNAALVKAQKMVEDAAAALNKAQAAHGAALSARRQLVDQYDRQQNAIKRQLVESADPRIDEAIIFFNDSLLRSRAADRIILEKSIRGYKNSGEEVWKIETNRPAIIRKHEYLRAAISTLEAMKLQPDYNETAVQALIDGIPDISVFTEVQ